MILAQLRPTVAAPPQTGPPDVARELALPSDSLTAAMAELDALQAIARGLTNAYPPLVASAESTRLAAIEAARSVERTRTAHDQARSRVARTMLDAARSSRPTELSGSDLGARRDLKLLQATMLALRREEAHQDRISTDAEHVRAYTEALRANHAAAAVAVYAEISGVTAKLTSTRVGVAFAGHVTAVDPGPTEVARLARAAELALDSNIGVAGSRRQLAEAVGAQTQLDPVRFDTEWAATPVPALRSTYFALSQVGKPYVYAADGPESYDCSGLTRRAWQQAGISLPHFSGAQLHSGLPVAPAQVRPGDLLTYGPDGSEHVVQYIGAGFDVEAMGRQWGIVIERADTNAAGGNFAGASRPLP